MLLCLALVDDRHGMEETEEMATRASYGAIGINNGSCRLAACNWSPMGLAALPGHTRTILYTSSVTDSHLYGRATLSSGSDKPRLAGQMAVVSSLFVFAHSSSGLYIRGTLLTDLSHTRATKRTG